MADKPKHPTNTPGHYWHALADAFVAAGFGEDDTISVHIEDAQPAIVIRKPVNDSVEFYHEEAAVYWNTGKVVLKRLHA